MEQMDLPENLIYEGADEEEDGIEIEESKKDIKDKTKYYIG
jgi:hypothetical protein